VTITEPKASDNCKVEKIEGVRSDGKALTDPYPIGITVITWTATDSAGLTSSCTQNVTVEDRIAPEMGCPAGIQVNNQFGFCSALVDVTVPSAGDNCTLKGVTGTRSDGKPLADPYPVGTTIITWIAEDAAGNKTTCTQAITVREVYPGCNAGCSHGFWRAHTQLWDQTTDVIAGQAGFTTQTSLNAFFGLTAAQSGLPDAFTMLDAMTAEGGGIDNLVRQGAAGLLSLGAGMMFPLPNGITDFTSLKAAIREALINKTYEPLATLLDVYGKVNCQLSGEFVPANVLHALRIAAGLDLILVGDMAVLNVESAGTSSGKIDIVDVVSLLRMSLLQNAQP
jgi:hypothetical protein